MPARLASVAAAERRVAGESSVLDADEPASSPDAAAELRGLAARDDQAFEEVLRTADGVDRAVQTGCVDRGLAGADGGADVGVGGQIEIAGGRRVLTRAGDAQRVGLATGQLDLGGVGIGVGLHHRGSQRTGSAHVGADPVAGVRVHRVDQRVDDEELGRSRWHTCRSQHHQNSTEDQTQDTTHSSSPQNGPGRAAASHATCGRGAAANPPPSIPWATPSCRLASGFVGDLGDGYKDDHSTLPRGTSVAWHRCSTLCALSVGSACGDVDVNDDLWEEHAAAMQGFNGEIPERRTALSG